MPLNITQLDEYFAQLGLGSAVIAGISAGFLLFAFEYLPWWNAPFNQGRIMIIM